MKQVNVKKLILPNIPYVFIALLATKVSEAVRLAPGSDASTKLLNIMTGLNTAFHSLVPSFHPIDLCVGVAAAIAIRLVVYIKGKNAKKFRKNLEYGSARWAARPKWAQEPTCRIVWSHFTIWIARGVPVISHSEKAASSVRAIRTSSFMSAAM